MRVWIPGSTEAIRNVDRALAHAVRVRLNCPHDTDTEILHLRKLHDYPRAVRFLCPHCPHDVFVKRFGEDIEAAEEKRELRMDIERGNLQLLWEKDIFCEHLRAPRLVGYVGSPHFAVIEEFVNNDELLVLLMSVARGEKSDTDLYAALAAIAQLVARLHETPLTSADNLMLEGRLLPSQSTGFSREMLKAEKFTEQFSQLCALHKAWTSDEFFRHAIARVSLIHGGMTCVNLLFSPNQGLTVIDFETLCVGPRYIDVGSLTAEIKTSFQLHGGNSFASEPYIRVFLEEYYAHTKLNVTYRQFTWLQAYFMGQRLLLMSVGRTFDDAMKRWLAHCALDVWKLVESERAFIEA